MQRRHEIEQTLRFERALWLRRLLDSAEICGEDAGLWADGANRLGIIADADDRIRSKGRAIYKIDQCAVLSSRLHLWDCHSDGGCHRVRDYNVRYSALVRLMNHKVSFFPRDVTGLQHQFMMLCNEINQLQHIR